MENYFLPMNQLPKEFLQILNSSLPQEVVQELLLGMEQPSTSSIRLNPAKKDSVAWKWPQNAIQVPWEEHAKHLAIRPSFVADPWFHGGLYYVQESSSMFIGHAIKQILNEFTSPVKLLDLCAAPGGKSTQLLSMLRPNDLLIANEVIKSRANILNENLTKWGNASRIVSSADPKKIGESGISFDIILADLPCSGEGLFRRDPSSVNEWSLSNVELCRQRQRRIIADIWPSLNDNGFLIYSTCTFNIQENEENIRWIIHELGADIFTISIDSQWGIYIQEDGCYRFLPGKTMGEGFFCAVLRKNKSTRKENKKRSGYNKWQPVSPAPFGLDESHALFQLNDYLHAIPHHSLDVFNDALSMMPNIISWGHMIGRNIKGKVKPDATLPLLENWIGQDFKGFESNDEQALSFLCRDTIILDQENGIYFWSYKGLKIGLISVDKKRVGHYWPMDWRIRNKPDIKALSNNQQVLSIFLDEA